MNGVGIRKVHHERDEAVTELSLKTRVVSLLAYRTEQAKSFETSTFVLPHPIPVETPVTTTSLHLCCSPSHFSLSMITVHVTFLLCDRARFTEPNGFVVHFVCEFYLPTFGANLCCDGVDRRPSGVLLMKIAFQYREQARRVCRYVLNLG
jgi:hypothetical protein